MNKWLYRAAGAVGVASGTLLLSSGVAHAETQTALDPQTMRDGVAEYFTPNGPREEVLGSLLGGGGGGGSGPLGGLTGGLGGLTGGLTGGEGNSLLNGITGDGDRQGGDAPGKAAGVANSLSELTGGLVGLAGGKGSTAITTAFTDDGSPLRKLTSGLISDDSSITNRLTGKLLGDGGSGTQQQDVTDSLSALMTQDRMRGASRGPADTNLVDPMLLGTTIDTIDQRGIPLAPATAGAPTAPLAPALIADAVTKQMGVSTGMLLPGAVLSHGDAAASARVAPQGAAQEESFPLIGDLPLVGGIFGGEGPLGNLVGGGLLNNGLLRSGEGQGLPLVGDLPLLGALTNLTGKAPAGPTAPAQPGMLPAAGASANTPAQTLPAPGVTAQNPASPTVRDLKPAAGNRTKNPAKGPLHVGKHRATERPELTDPDYLESGSLPLIGSLTSSELPLLGPLLKGLPLTGGLL